MPDAAGRSGRPDLLFGDRIELRGLRVTCVVGVLDHERETPQPIELDIDIHTRLAAAGVSDSVADTVDYATAAEAAAAVCVEARAQLLERLAHAVATELCALDGVAAATVAVRKLRPPVPLQLDSTAVRVTRFAAAAADAAVPRR